MTNQPQYPLAAAVIAGALNDADEERNDRETVGASDADADAQRAGAPVDLTRAHRDWDGVPVGRADAEEDTRRAGARPETD